MKKQLSYIFVTISLIMLSGCMTPGVLSETKSYTGTYTWITKGKIFSIIKTVAEEKKYNIEEETPTLLKIGTTSSASTILYGNNLTVNIYFTTRDSFEHTMIKINIVGNYDQGTKENADKIIQEFRNGVVKEYKRRKQML